MHIHMKIDHGQQNLVVWRVLLFGEEKEEEEAENEEEEEDM